MIIYKDIFTGDELFTDIFNPKPEDEDFIITVDAKMTKRKTDEISDAVFGGNASQEEQSEQVDDAQDQQGLDIVLNHKLEDVTSFFADKKSVTSYMKKYCKNLAAKLDEGDCEGDKEKCKKFKACCSGGKLANFVSKWSSDTSVFVGEHMDYFAEEKACLLLGNWGEDGMTVKFYCLSDGLHVEKQTGDGTPYRSHGYVLLRFRGNVVMKMGTQQQHNNQDSKYFAISYKTRRPSCYS